MKKHLPANIVYVIVLLLTGVQSVFAQKEEKEEELKLNSDAVKLIRFNFNAKEMIQEQKPIENLQGKNWMKFRHGAFISWNKNDSTDTGNPRRFIRMLPYSIWTKFGEDPVYDVIFSRERREKMTFVLDPFRQNGKNRDKWAFTWSEDIYSNTQSKSANSNIGIELDFNKLYYENLTKRGRAIKHNRKHANAWKTYQAYLPTKKDREMYPTFYRSPQTANDTTATDTATVTNDSVHFTNTSPLQSPFLPYLLLPIYTTPSDSSDTTYQDSLRKEKEGNGEKEESSSLYEYIRRQQAADSIRKQRIRTKEKFKRENAYDIEQQKRFLKEQRN